MATAGDDERKRAIRRLRAKRGFRMHFTIYIVAAIGFVLIWTLSGGGYFWPVWAIAGWSIGIFFHWWGVLGQKPISEDEIRREMERGSPAP